MKKLKYMISGLLILTSLAFVGCGNPEASNINTEVSNTQVTEQQEKEPEIKPEVKEKVVDNKQKNEKIANTTTDTNATTPAKEVNSASSSSSNDENTIVYYVKDSSVYHLDKNDATLKKSKNILQMTLKEAQAKGMHETKSKADGK